MIDIDLEKLTEQQWRELGDFCHTIEKQHGCLKKILSNDDVGLLDGLRMAWDHDSGSPCLVPENFVDQEFTGTAWEKDFIALDEERILKRFRRD